MTITNNDRKMIAVYIFLSTLFLIALFSGPVSANHTCGAAPLPTCGAKSGLVPTHKDAVGASIVWPNESDCPKFLTWMRPSEYRAQQFLNPPVGDGSTFPGFSQNYVNLVQGGFNLGGLDRSGWTHYPPDVNKENTQLSDVCGLQSLIDTGIFTKERLQDITNADLALTEPFFQDAGYSKGLTYNAFCAGNVAGADGRMYIVGGHDKGGNNGIKKILIFDPVAERWLPRTVPCVKSQFEADPTGTAFPHCSARDENNTDPPDPSDMRYQRWYNSAVTLPDGRILGLNGQDRDTSGGPGPSLSTTITQGVPEVYDPVTDRTITLENAYKDFTMFPRAFPVQTGPNKDDWKVCMPGAIIPPYPGQDPNAPSQILNYNPFRSNGETWCLDVLGALADPNRDVRASNHWQYLATSIGGAHYQGAGVRMVTVNADGSYSQKAFLFGGNNGYGSSTNAIAEKIDYSAPNPQWQRMDDLDTATQDNNVVPLPDGKLLVVGGGSVINAQKHLQLYDPETGSKQDLLEITIFRGDHGSAFVLPNGGVWVTGGNRVDFLPGQDNDLAVPTIEYYRPPYFFKGPRPTISKAPTKVMHGQEFPIEVSTPGQPIGSVVLLRTGPITHAWAWGSDYVKLPFKGKKEKDKGKGKDKGKDKEKSDKLQVMMPSQQALVIGGDYMMFAVSEDGIPSEGKHIFVNLKGKDKGKDKDKDKDKGKGKDKDAALKQKTFPAAIKPAFSVGGLNSSKASVVSTEPTAIR